MDLPGDHFHASADRIHGMQRRMNAIGARIRAMRDHVNPIARR
jgi:hypothetical protein